MTPQGPALIWCPFADEASAAKAASQLLDEGLIACANILPGVRSLYVWKGERGEAAETAVLFKTDIALLDRAVARLGEIHPYDTPAIIGWRADVAAPATATWLGELAERAE
jgi:periplasmic divalent cation tolerance protein